LLALFVSFLVAFSNAKSESNAVYEYVTLTQLGFSEVAISEQGKELRVNKIETKPKSQFNFRTLYTEINKYEAEGWELFGNNNLAPGTGGANQYSFLLRRKMQ
jgi:hypothetical protein